MKTAAMAVAVAAVTAVLASVGRANPQRFCGLTMRLQGLVGEAAGITPATLAA